MSTESLTDVSTIEVSYRGVFVMRGKSGCFGEVLPTAGLISGDGWGYDGSSGYLAYIESSLSATGSTEPLGNYRFPHSDAIKQNPLLDLCDSIRAGLDDRRNPSSRWEEVMVFLAAVVRDETNGMSMIDFATIRNSCLDKLLSDMVNPKNRPMPVTTGFQRDVALAERLLRLWRARFREHYFTIDQYRYFDLPRIGRLKDVEMSSAGDNIQGHWRAKDFEPLSELEGNQFEPGHWWLNLACAHRDGIVGSAFETPTKGKYGIAALPLVTGGEEVQLPNRTVKYTREGKLSEMHLSLISQVGSQIRILRGHRLQSPLAPEAGIRYDGLYKICQYGHKLNMNTELHHVVLTLERAKDQLPMEIVLRIPRPSQLDDWQLFEKYEGEMIKQIKGQQTWLDWKMDKAQEVIDREQYMRTLAFQTSLELAKFERPSPLLGSTVKAKREGARIL